MKPIEIPFDDLNEIDILGENPIYKFEELLNEIGNNDLEMILQGYLGLDINSDHITDYEINNDVVILYVDK